MNKIVDLDFLKKISDQREEKKIVFTNGCFDIVHVGHIRLLKECKVEGDILVVGINSDESVRKIKGFCRPIIPQEERAEILEAIQYVDYIVFFDEETPEFLIKILKPDILVKGEDWEENKIVGADFIRSYGGKVVRIQHTKPISTTNIIFKILKLYRDKIPCHM